MNPQEGRRKELELLEWAHERTQLICQWINDVEKLTLESNKRILGVMLWRIKYASDPLGNYVSNGGIAHKIRMNQREWERIEKKLLDTPELLVQAQAGLKEWLDLNRAIEGVNLGELKSMNRIEEVIGEQYSLMKRADSERWLRGIDVIHLYVDIVSQTYQWTKYNEEGDVIAWVMRRNFWSLAQAVFWLKQRAGKNEKEKSNG